MRIKHKEVYFQTLYDLDTLVVNNLHLIPRDVDLIVGIPRSGMLLAGIICMYINKPLVTLGELLSDANYHIGYYRTPPQTTHGKVLIVDDAIGTGRTLQNLKAKLSQKNFNIVYLTGYASEKTKNLVDICLEVQPIPRAWQWNVFHHPSRRMMWDLDGVICENPQKMIKSHLQEEYEVHLANAKPLILPSFPVDIATGRREIFRNKTMQWLNEYNVKYYKLIMRPVGIEGWKQIAKYKAEHYASSDKELFIESSLKQAQIIAHITNKPVFCVEDRKLYTKP